MNKLVHPGGNVRLIERTRRPAGGPIDFAAFKRKSWPGVSAESVRLEGPTEYDFRLEAATNFLMLLDLQRVDGETAMAGVPRTFRKNLRHRLTFAPQHCEISGWSKLIKPASFTAVYFDPQPLDRERCDLSQLPPAIEFEDNMLRTAMLQFGAILKDPALDQPGYAETLALLLAFELNRMRSQQSSTATVQGALPPRQVRIVLDYIESHMTDNTTIAELSALLDLSRFHFIRAFKKAVGMPPHQFMLHRRIERARELLTDRDLTIAEIAQRTGFNGTAQLSRVFRQIVGTTPSDFRRGML